MKQRFYGWMESPDTALSCCKKHIYWRLLLSLVGARPIDDHEFIHKNLSVEFLCLVGLVFILNVLKTAFDSDTLAFSHEFLDFLRCRSKCDDIVPLRLFSKFMLLVVVFLVCGKSELRQLTAFFVDDPDLRIRPRTPD